MKKIEILDGNFKRYINGKRVIYVGPAPCIRGLGMGHEIDNYDIIVRSNNFINLIDSKEIQKDYGKRCNVLYINRQFDREMRPHPVEKWIKKGLEWMCFKGVKGSDKRRYQRLVKVRNVTETITELVKIEPSILMGAVSLVDLASCDPAELRVVGIDFNITRPKVFKHDQYPEYVDGYLPDRIREQGNRINAGKTEDGHNVSGNTRIIYELWKSKRLTMPKETEDIMIGIINGEIEQS